MPAMAPMIPCVGGFRDGLAEHSPAAPHDRHAIGDLEYVREGVRDEDHGEIALGYARGSMSREHVRGLLRRERGDGLVENQHSPPQIAARATATACR